MRLQDTLLVGALAELGLAAEPARPRGVGPEFAKFYASPDTFACISNPSIRLPAARVNDDFCDCPDGSDEPGTAACAHLAYEALAPQPGDPAANATLALPGFYCKNRGHNPGYVPFTHVNDGVCDYAACCDGSDEWAAPRGARCEDRCASIGAEWRRVDEQRQISLNAAGRQRVELVAQAATRRKEIEDYLASSQAELRAFEARVAQLQREADTIEKAEKSRVVRKQSAGGKAGVLAGLAKEKLAQLRDALAFVKADRDAERAKVAELEGILAAFKTDYNPNFNDEGVKRAVRAWEEYAARDKGAQDDARERDAADLASGGDGIPWEDFETGDDAGGLAGDIETLYSFEEYLPLFLREWLDGQLRSLRATLVANGILPPDPADASAADTPAVREAKERLSSAQSDLTNLENERRGKSEDLAREHGPDDVFRTLAGKCIATDSGEYTYELCFLENVNQKPKKGGASNSMGKWGRFDTVHVDEDVGADGRGLGTGERLAMRFEGGAGCWQGPARSTTVIMACFERDEVWRVFEEEKCVYRMEIGTPAVCEVPSGAGPRGEGTDVGKEEL